MKTILLLDLECTGLDPTHDVPIELAAALWSVEHRTTIATSSTLIRCIDNPAERINCISPAASQGGEDRDVAFAKLLPWVERADAIVGHNAYAFDRLFCPPDWDMGKPWIDSMTDIEWPRSSSSQSLVAIALAHGVAVTSSHRALDDVMTLVRLLERVGELVRDVNAMLERGLRPKGRFRAKVTYAERSLAKEAGFRWDDKAREWTRWMAVEDAALLPFGTERIEPF